MLRTPSVVHAVSALAVGLLVSCRGDGASPVDDRATGSSSEKAEQELPAPPREVEPPKPEPPKPEPPKPEPPKPTLEMLVEGLDIAWYDAKPEDELELLCDYTLFEQRGQLDERTPCTTVVETVHVVDGQGNAPWNVVERRNALWLARPGATFPKPSTPVLALLDAPAKDARLSPVSTSRPAKRSKSVRQAVVKAIDEGADLSLRPRFEIHGAFGGDADTLVVFRVEDSVELQGYEAIVAFAGDRLVGVVGEPPLFFSGHEVAGVTDLDGDGAWEVLWWGRAEDGFGLHLIWFAKGQYRRTRVFSCECAPYFADAYPVLRKR